MTFQFYPKRNDALYTTERYSKSRITYYSKYKMDVLYPDGGYEIIGEIGNFAKRNPKLDEILTDAGKYIHIFPRGSLKKPFEWVAGYAAVGENTYVEVIKSIIPRFINMNKSN